MVPSPVSWCLAPRAVLALVAAAWVACACAREPDAAPPRSGSRRPPALALVETVYDGKLGAGWQDWGWAGRELGHGPARLSLQSYGGWIIAHPGLTKRFGALSFRMQAPRAFGDFLEVRVASDRKNELPRVLVLPEHRAELADGWSEVVVAVSSLDPERLGFDRIVLRAAKLVGPGVVLIDKIGFTAPDADDAVPAPPPVRDATLAIDCRAAGRPISPWIYGIAFDPRLDAQSSHQWHLAPSARRWGGNPSSRFNWVLGNAWNTANDWYFENVNFTGDASWSWSRFLDDDLAHGVVTALTVPMLGWVAKDTTSYSFSVAALGPQQAVDGYKPDAGNGKNTKGESLAPPAPARTSVASSPASIGRWVSAIRERDARSGKRSVHIYILDNEPMLWSSTHRDVHPEPVGYDELLERTLAYAAAIRAADPDAKIAGPALWGWPAYLFSAKDAAAGFHLKPDRRAHGDVPLLPWYLREVRAHERRTGQRLLDLVDVHFYPQGERIGGADGGTDAVTAERRVRATRGLWDPSYEDESWIRDRIQLIPRLRGWIEEQAPGLGIQIGEWNFGAEKHSSGGLAVAEALGRFAENGVTSAFYWTFPPAGSPAFWAFRAFRDFDGAGGRFLDVSLPTTSADGVSTFASRDAAATRLVVVVLVHTAAAVRAPIALTGAQPVRSVRRWSFTGAPTGFVEAPASAAAGVVHTEPLAPHSINVFDIQLQEKP